METQTVEVPGKKAVQLLNEHRSRYHTTGLYPFLIGDSEELERIEETAEFNHQDSASIIQRSLNLKIADWIASRRNEAEEDEFHPDEILGEWPGEIAGKGSIGIHEDVVSGKLKPVVYLGLARIESPWQLPAIVKFGAWNACPEPAVHCALHRYWQESYGAEITSMSGDVVECTVGRPPTDRDTAISLAWQQYWYCADIVEQGCGSVSNLAATLLNSPYWYFWWD